MQLLYGNNGVDYDILAKTPDMNNRIIDELENRRFLSYDFTKKEYPEGEEPEALSFITTVLNGVLKEPKLILSQSKRMVTFQTPCYMSHIQIMDMQEGMRSYRNSEISALLEMKFISALEANQYQQGKLLLENFNGRDKDIERTEEEYNCGMPELAREAVISLLMECDENLRKVTLIVDVNNEDYNRRTKEILRDIYTHMPYGWRSRFGFCSFITSNIQSPEGVKLQFVERGTQTDGFSNVIDLSETEDDYYESRMEGVRLEYREYVHAFLNKTEEERKKFFESLAECFEIGENVREYYEWQQNLEQWAAGIHNIQGEREDNNQKQMQLLVNSWIKYLRTHADKKNSMLMSRFRNKVLEYLDGYSGKIMLYLEIENNWYLRKYCERSLEENEKKLQDYTAILRKFSNFFEFTERYPIIVENQIESFIRQVVDWDNAKNGEVLKQRLEKLNKSIKELCKALGKYFIEGFYLEWEELYPKQYERAENLAEDLLEQKNKREQKEISRIFSEEGHFEEFYHTYFKSVDNYSPENQNQFKIMLGNWLVTKKNTLSFGNNMKKMKEWFNRYAEYISEETRKIYFKRWKESLENDWGKLLEEYALYEALEELDTKAGGYDSIKRKWLVDFLSKWLDKNLWYYSQKKPRQRDAVKSTLLNFSYLGADFEKQQIDEWIKKLEFQKHKEYHNWNNIQKVALFLEYAENGEILYDNYNYNYHDYDDYNYTLIQNDGTIAEFDMNLEQAKEVARFLLKLQEELKIRDEHVLRVLTKSPLLQSSHWICLLSNSEQDFDNIIWSAYFNFTDVMVEDTYIKQFAKDMIQQELEEKKRRSINIPEKQAQYERLFITKSIQDLEEEMEMYQQRWEMLIWTLPAGLTALLQVLLVKICSNSLTYIGYYIAAFMTAVGIGIGVKALIIDNRENHEKDIAVSIPKLAGAIMFLVTGWIVALLRMLV